MITELPLNKILEGDCLELMKTLPDNSIDLILTDPPYFKMKTDNWDNQWKTSDDFIEWIDKLTEQWFRILKPNGSLYCFASHKMSARVEVTIQKRFNVLTRITWDKKLQTSGKHHLKSKSDLRTFFTASESIIFAEHYESDNIVKGELVDSKKYDSSIGFIYDSIRAYLENERLKSGLRTQQIIDWFSERGYPKFVTAGHSFSTQKWWFPTSENYERLRNCFYELSGLELLTKPYESLRLEYESLRLEYESLRRPFKVSLEVPYTDVWSFKTVQAYKGKHVCEKPSDLLEHVITSSTNKDSVILDCFVGSGSTLVAAQKLGRSFIGMELDPHWVNTATNTIKSKVTLEGK